MSIRARCGYSATSFLTHVESHASMKLEEKLLVWGRGRSEEETAILSYRTHTREREATCEEGGREQTVESEGGGQGSQGEPEPTGNVCLQLHHKARHFLH